MMFTLFSVYHVHHLARVCLLVPNTKYSRGLWACRQFCIYLVMNQSIGQIKIFHLIMVMKEKWKVQAWHISIWRWWTDRMTLTSLTLVTSWLWSENLASSCHAFTLYPWEWPCSWLKILVWLKALFGLGVEINHVILVCSWTDSTVQPATHTWICTCKTLYVPID